MYFVFDQLGNSLIATQIKISFNHVNPIWFQNSNHSSSSKLYFFTKTEFSHKKITLLHKSKVYCSSFWLFLRQRIIYYWVSSLLKYFHKHTDDRYAYIQQKLASLLYIISRRKYKNMTSHPKSTQEFIFLLSSDILSIFKRCILLSFASLQSQISWVPSENRHMTIVMPKRLFHSWDMFRF